MKYSATISIFIFMVIGQLFAQPKARFTISTTGTISLLSTINGVNYILPNMAQTWYDLEPGTIQVTVFQYQSPSGADAGYKEIYKGAVKLSPGRHTELVVSRWGKIMFDENEIVADSWATGIPGILGNAAGIGNGWQQVAVNETSFAEIKKALEQEMFTDGKLKLARVLFKNNAFNTTQIGELSKQFTFEDDKLNFVKLAYPSCVDKGNYYLLARLFMFNNNRDALLEFLAKQ